MVAGGKKPERECFVVQRKSLIDRIFHRKTLLLQAKWEQDNARQIHQACHFTSPVTSRTESVLYQTQHLCRLLREQASAAAGRPSQTQTALQFRAYDADADYGVKRKQKIAENLEHHFRIDGKLYKDIVDRTQRALSGSGRELCSAVVTSLTAGCSVIATYQLSVVPKKVLSDLKKFLRFSLLDDSRTDALLLGQVEKSLDNLDYDTYLAWEGSWRKVRPAGQCYPKRSTLLSVVISSLLNLKWRPVMPVQLNFLSPVLLKVAVVGVPYSGKTKIARRIVDYYGLDYIEISQLYQDYLNAFDKLKLGAIGSEFLSSMTMYEADIRSAAATGIQLSDDLNMELMLGYLRYKEGSVHGFVFDGFPSTLPQVRDFRNRLDGFDSERVLETHQREKSKLVDDPLDPGEPLLPHCLMDLVIFLNLDDQSSLQRLREADYLEHCQDEAFVAEVNDTPFDAAKLAVVQRRLLQLKRDCQDGLLNLYRRSTKTFLELDGTRNPDSLFLDIQTALRGEMQKRFDDITAAPSLNVIKGLHQSQDKYYEPIIPSALGIPPAPDPKTISGLPKSVGIPCQYTTGGPLAVEYVKFELRNDTCCGEVRRMIEERREKQKLAVAAALPLPPTGLPKVPDDDQQPPTMEEQLTARKAFRKFVLGEDPTDVPLVSPVVVIEEPTKDHHKEVHKKDGPKKKDDLKVKVVSPVAKKVAKEVTVVDDYDEMGLLKPIRQPRKADLANNLVKEYAQFTALEDSDMGVNPPATPYGLEHSWLDCDSATEEIGCACMIQTLPQVAEDPAAVPSGLSQKEMTDYFANRKAAITKCLAAAAIRNEKCMECAYIEGNVGASSPSGYPVMRLCDAKILESQLAAEEKLLQLLDQRFPIDQETVILPTDRVADFGDSDYRKIIVEPKELKDTVQAVTTPGQPLLQTAVTTVVPPVASGRTPSPASAAATLGTSVKFDEGQSLAQSHSAAGKIGISKSKQRLAVSPSNMALPVHNYEEICDWLADRWRKLEQNHGTFTRQIFQTVRRLQEAIIQQVDSCRKSFFDLGISHALHFEDLLYKWQVQFNSLDQSKRTRIQFKELLHAQTMDFQKTLTEDANLCRQKDATLHYEIMRSGWLEDLISMIFNSFVGLVQLELDTHLDTLLLLRDFISTTEYHLIGTQNPTVFAIPYIELPVDKDGRQRVKSSTSPRSETKKLRTVETEKKNSAAANKELTPQSILRPLTLDPVTPFVIPRKILAGEAVAQFDQNNSVKSRAGATKDRKSQQASYSRMDSTVTRKHSKTQAGGTPTSRDEIEELMLKVIIEKAKEGAFRIQETEQEARKARCNTRLPEDPGQTKKPVPAKPIPSALKSAAVASPGGEPQPAVPLTAHERAINEETNCLFLRLDAISNYAIMIMSDMKKITRALDDKIAHSIEENHRSELASAAMLTEYVHAQIENEEPVRQAMVYFENRFALSVGQFVRTGSEPAAVPAVNSADKLSLYEEFKKLSSGCDEMVYEDLQRAIVGAVEKSYGTDLVHREWQLLDSDDLSALVCAVVKPKVDRCPDGVNVCDLMVGWRSVLKLLSNPPPLDLIKK